MKIPYIIQEFINNEWVGVSAPFTKTYADAQFEAMVNMKRNVRMIYDGLVIRQEGG